VGDSFVKTYSKDELKQTVPANPVVGLDKRLIQEVTGVLGQVRGQLAGAPQAAALEGLKTAQPDEAKWNFHVAAMADEPPTTKTNIDAVRSFFSTETQKAATTSARGRIELFNKISALSFNLDLGALFAGKKPKAAAQSGEVRYGLVVQDIVPDMNAPQRAALTSAQSEMVYAGHAEVKWTIGPLEESESRKIMAGESEDGSGRTSIGGFKIPSAKFRGSAQPEGFENAAGVKGKENIPNWRFDLLQEEGLYNLTYRTKTTGERVSVEHAVTAPVAGTVALGRRFSDNWDVVQTSVYNVLYDKRLPLLSVHHMHVEERYKADVTKAIGKHTVGIAARGKAHGPVPVAGEEPENYAVTYSTDF
jgi:hypothetical protein